MERRNRVVMGPSLVGNVHLCMRDALVKERTFVVFVDRESFCSLHGGQMLRRQVRVGRTVQPQIGRHSSLFLRSKGISGGG